MWWTRNFLQAASASKKRRVNAEEAKEAVRNKADEFLALIDKSDSKTT